MEDNKKELEEIKEMLELYFIKTEQHQRKIKNRLLAFMIIFAVFAITVLLLLIC